MYILLMFSAVLCIEAVRLRCRLGGVVAERSLTSCIVCQIGPIAGGLAMVWFLSVCDSCMTHFTSSLFCCSWTPRPSSSPALLCATGGFEPRMDAEARTLPWAEVLPLDMGSIARFRWCKGRAALALVRSPNVG